MSIAHMETERPNSDILVVDDNPANLLAIEAALGELGGRAVRAHSGGEALRYLLDHDVALILLDVNMPSLDGFETARLIRSRKRSSHTPIIFITAYGRDDADVLAAYELGAVDFLFKPIIPAILHAKASVFVELQSRTAEVARQAEQIREHERREHERCLLAERTRWEGEALLRQIVQMAEADRRKDQFLAVLSHELRNPLAPVLAGLELLRAKFDSTGAGGVIDEDARRTRDVIERQAQHLARLVDDLLEISRITSGKIELRTATVSIGDVIEQAVATSRPLIDASGHTLQVVGLPAPVYVNGDAVRLVQMLSNLLNNAARYTPSGGMIIVQARCEAGVVEISVVDNGRGISAEFLDRVFDVFSQERAHSGTGLGLGLALVRQLVQLHKGEVVASSEGLGRGSTFTLRLPMVPAHASDVGAVAPDGSECVALARRQPETSVGCLAAEARELSIVLIEDNPDICELMANLLRSWGHQVEVAGDGEEGCELALRARPDIAFVDIGLPDVDGYRVAERIRRQLASNDLRLVAMTGFGQASDKRRAIDAGFDAHIVKPVSIDVLKQVLAF